MDGLENLLTNVRKHGPMPEATWQLLAPLLRRIDVPEKGLLLEQGEVANHYYFVEAGMLRLVHLAEDGRDYTFFLFREGQICGSMESYTTQSPSRYALEALEPATVWSLHRDAHQRLMDESSAFERLVRMATERRLVELLEFYAGFILDSPEQRYAKLLAAHPDYGQRVPLQVLASFLGITPQSLSRLRKRMAEGGA